MTAGLTVVAALAVAVYIGGCATQGRAPSAVVTPLATKAVSAERVKHGAVPGRSTRADVLAALGESLVIRFDSGYEVWVYRLDNATPRNEAPLRRFLQGKVERPAADEFVILFAPSGVVAKTRIRPAPAPRKWGSE
jgi:hypothetical protein